MGDYFSVLDEVRNKNPLVLQITNAVTINDCANITICVGASPVMSNDADDAAELAGKADALLLNIGTADSKQIEIMRSAADSAIDNAVPLILDPVGAGASELRKKTVCEFINNHSFAVIKGNAGEINALAGLNSSMRGVDSADAVQTAAAAELSEKTGAVIAVSGIVDIVTDGVRAAEIANGHPLMGKISGTGCMAGSCMAAFCAASPAYTAAVSAFCALGAAGEIAAVNSAGPGSFRPAFFDAAANLTADNLAKYAKIREVVL
ncbi:MAG TPA: hydroxyethylthiazole kinase [Methanocorpusculum sp.]|nr:hydroxyethylthiazole kinase [Methanocorpusculum sp.]